jgi:hypothetical protein
MLLHLHQTLIRKLRSTFLFLPLSTFLQSIRGAGVTVKYAVDATLEAIPSGQTADQAAYEGHMHFTQYLGSKTLSVDVWDGESLLQVCVVVWMGGEQENEP